MAEEPTGDGIGIMPTGRSEPYAEDTDPVDEISAMFADEDEDDETDVPPEPATLPDDDEENPQPPPPPETDDDEEGPLVTEGSTDEELASEVDEETRRFADRFASVEDLERSYKEIQGGFTRMAQDLRAADERDRERDEELERTRQELNNLTTLITRQMAEQDPEFAERLARQQEIAQTVRNQIDQEFEPYDPEEEARIEAEERYTSAARSNIAAFYQRSGVAPGSDDDAKMDRAMRVLLSSGVQVDLSSPGHLDAIHEASKDDNLLLELTMAPNAINVPGGLDRLKGRLGGATVSPTNAVPSPEQETQPRSTQGPRRRRVEAHVEAPGGGAPVPSAPGEDADEFDQAVKLYNSRYRKGPIFGSKR